TWKRAEGRTTRFLWDGQRMLHEYVEGESPTTWLYDPDDGHPVGKLVATEAFAVVSDHTGAPSQVLDRGGQQLWAAHTSITGALQVIEGRREACALRWPGMYEDEETGLQFEYREGIGARYYDSAAGAYVDQGPLAAAPTLRAYGHGYAFGVEWAATRADPGPGFESESQRTADVLERLVMNERTSSLAPGGAYGSHVWSTTLTPSRDVADRADASDTPAFLSTPMSNRSAFNDPNLQFMERACEFEPMKPGPLPLPQLSR
ncbi:MAG TPA: hypothetical protein VFG30_44970, partial [Polyangiales bacterium]|nr:hypothetical protein [Polyangiales bacterium]